MREVPPTLRRPFILLAAMFMASACSDDNGTGSEIVATVSVTAGASTLVSFDETVTLSAAAQSSDGSAIAGKAFTWSSSDDGVATVVNGVVTAVGNGTATITASTDGVNGTATVTVQQTAAQVGFRTIAAATVRTPMGSVTVEIQDANGNLVAGAAGDIDISLGDNPGNLILHTSGISSAPDRWVELVDHAAPLVLAPPLSQGQGTDETLAMDFDPASGLVLGTDRDEVLNTIDPTTGVMTVVGTLGSATNPVTIKGLAFDTSEGDLLGVERDSDILMTIDPATGDTVLVGRLLINEDSIEGFTGLDEDPTTGIMWGVAKLRDNPDSQTRTLVTIDRMTLTATRVATLSETGVAAITFLSNGILLAVTGDGGGTGVRETLFSVNTADGAMTLVLGMGNGSDGESIEAIPARLSGTLTSAAVGGVATFTDLEIDGSGSAFTLSAVSAGLTDGESASFAVNQPADPNTAGRR